VTIDLRSDTVTRPTEAMRAAMAAAPVGDDCYGDDPTVLELERRTAEILGKEAAMYVPTGTMSNQPALRAHTEPGDAVLIGPGAHIWFGEGGAPSPISGVVIRPLEGDRGMFGAATLRAALNLDMGTVRARMQSPVRLVCAENTHNGAGGHTAPPAPLCVFSAQPSRTPPARCTRSSTTAVGSRRTTPGRRGWPADSPRSPDWRSTSKAWRRTSSASGARRSTRRSSRPAAAGTGSC